MKRVMILAMIAIIASAAVSAGDMQIGVAQNLLNTSFLFDAEFEYGGVEASVGLPVVPGAITAINAFVNNSEAEATEEESPSSFAAPLGAMANVYFKVIRGEKFSMRLGLQADVLGIFGPSFIWVTGYSGVSLGFNFRITDGFALNLTTAVPLVILLKPLGDGVAKYSMLFYSSGDGSPASDALIGICGGLGPIGSHVARLSCKWSI